MRSFKIRASIHANSQSRRLRPARFRRRPRLQQFRPAHRPRSLAQGDPPGDRPRHHAVRYRRHLCRDGRLGDRAGRGARRAAQGHRAGDQILQADEQGRHQAGRVAALHHVRGRGQPDAAEDRLHRSLPAARLRSADADRGNPARARRPDPAGQGALHRQFEFSGMAHRRGRVDGAADGRQPVRVVPGRIQPGGARHRKGSAAGGAGIQIGPAAVLPAGQRTADRQIQARRGRPRRHALCQGAGAARPLRHAAQRGHRREAAGASPKSAATACWNWRSPGWHRGRRCRA